MDEYKKVFQGTFYSIVEDENAILVLLEDRPVWGACGIHGNHSLFDLSCPYLENLVRKVKFPSKL